MVETLARQDQHCDRLMTRPGIGPTISSAMVAAIGTGDVFSKGRDLGAWLGLVVLSIPNYKIERPVPFVLPCAGPHDVAMC